AGSFLVSFIPVVTTFYIEAMGFRILRIMFGELLFFIRSEIDSQRLGQTLGDWTLNRIKPARILIELRFPQQRSVTCVGQLYCDVPAFADLSYPAMQHSIDLLFTANRGGICLLLLVLENGAGRAHIDLSERAESRNH